MIVSAWNPSVPDTSKSFEENVANNKALYRHAMPFFILCC
jgi:thymidylate synthase